MFKRQPHLLVVDDDDRLRDLLQKFLSGKGFYVTLAADVAEARHLLAQFVYDLLVVDVMMPGETGLEFMIWLRRHHPVPVLMLSAMGEAQDRIAGLERGVDDYLAKPFEPKELLLRVESILRRRGESRSRAVHFGAFVFHPESGSLEKAGAPVHLTTGEAALLALLVAHEGAPLNREDLYERLKPGDNVRSIDVQVTRLRRKLEENPRQPVYIRTVRGEGYAFFVR